MFRNKTILAILAVALASSIWSHSALAGKRDSKVIVIPARRRVVSLLHDLWRSTPLTLICYQGEVDTAAPTLHAWNGWEWVATTLDLEIAPDAVVLVGDDGIVPKVVTSELAGKPGFKRIDSLDVVAITRGLIEPLGLTTTDLKRIAKRNGMEFKDLNAERRKYGRYGKPGEEKDPMPPLHVEITPPVEPDDHPEGSGIPPEPEIEKKAGTEQTPAPEKETENPGPLPEDK